MKRLLNADVVLCASGRQDTRRETDSIAVYLYKEYVLKQRHNEMANKQMMSFTLPFPDIEIKIRGLCSSISSIRESYSLWL